MKEFFKGMAAAILILVIGLVIIPVLITANLHLFVDQNDLSEIETKNIEKKLEYASERGFGSDRFDIYSFNLTEEENLADFKKIDDFYYRTTANHFNTFLWKENESFKDSNTLKDMASKINALEKEADTQYLYFNKENIKKFIFIIVLKI